jgi:hypothetical protein
MKHKPFCACVPIGFTLFNIAKCTLLNRQKYFLQILSMLLLLTFEQHKNVFSWFQIQQLVTPSSANFSIFSFVVAFAFRLDHVHLFVNDIQFRNQYKSGISHNYGSIPISSTLTFIHCFCSIFTSAGL